MDEESEIVKSRQISGSSQYVKTTTDENIFHRIVSYIQSKMPEYKKKELDAPFFSVLISVFQHGMLTIRTHLTTMQLQVPT